MKRVLKPEVLGVGFHKTGTSTLRVALEILGYSVSTARIDLAKHLFENNLERIFEATKNKNAFQDNPWALLYQEFDKKFPGMKFILTMRNKEKWIKSIINHFGGQNTEMRKWIYGVSDPVNNEDVYLNRFDEHNTNVKKYFKNRKNDLLILSWEEGDGWEKLCNFLEKPIPSVDFPHANKRSYSKLSRIINKIKSTTKRKIKHFLKN